MEARERATHHDGDGAQRVGVERHVDTYLQRRRIRWAGHVARMGWHRTPRKLLSAWAYQENVRNWGRPMKRWAGSFEEDLKGAGVPVSKWHKLAQDKENWKDLISEIGEESKKSKAKKKRKIQWKPLASCTGVYTLHGRMRREMRQRTRLKTASK